MYIRIYACVCVEKAKERKLTRRIIYLSIPFKNKYFEVSSAAFLLFFKVHLQSRLQTTV